MLSSNLTPAEASIYLLERWGIRRSPQTLAKLRCLGGSPNFFKAGRAILYPSDGLDSWAITLLGEQVSSTSQLVKPNLSAGHYHAPR
jgi:hypothetical protein